VYIATFHVVEKPITYVLTTSNSI